MNYKHLSLIVLLLLVGSVLAASSIAETDKVVVLTYDSADEMLVDLGKVKSSLDQPKPQTKTWTYCKRYYCYQVELPVQNVKVLPIVEEYEPLYVKTLSPVYVQTYTRPEPVSKYRYNPVDGAYVNEWDDKEDYYRYKHCTKYRYNGERRWRCD